MSTLYLEKIRLNNYTTNHQPKPQPYRQCEEKFMKNELLLSGSRPLLHAENLFIKAVIIGDVVRKTIQRLYKKNGDYARSIYYLRDSSVP